MPTIEIVLQLLVSNYNSNSYLITNNLQYQMDGDEMVTDSIKCRFIDVIMEMGKEILLSTNTPIFLVSHWILHPTGDYN